MKAWQEQLVNFLPTLWGNEETANDKDDKPLCIGHLAGEGEWEQPTTQAEKIPKAVLEIIKEEAEKAFNLLPTKDPLPSLVSLKQRPD